MKVLQCVCAFALLLIIPSQAGASEGSLDFGGGAVYWWEVAEKDASGRLTAPEYQEGSAKITEYWTVKRPGADVCAHGKRKQRVIVVADIGADKLSCANMAKFAKGSYRARRNLKLRCSKGIVRRCRGEGIRFEVSSKFSAANMYDDMLAPRRTYKRCGVYLYNGNAASYYRESEQTCISDTVGAAISEGRCQAVGNSGLVCGDGRDNAILVYDQYVVSGWDETTMWGQKGMGLMMRKSFYPGFDAAAKRLTKPEAQ